MCVCLFVVFLFILRQDEDKIRILRELRTRKLPTGEPVYTESLANKLLLSQSAVEHYLSQLGLAVKNHGRWPAVTTPDSHVLDDKLSSLGFDVMVFKPMAARVNGFYHTIDNIVGYESSSEGRFRFTVQWNSDRHSHSVCCCDLNESARARVCFSQLWVID